MSSFSSKLTTSPSLLKCLDPLVVLILLANIGHAAASEFDTPQDTIGVCSVVVGGPSQCSTSAPPESDNTTTKTKKQGSKYLSKLVHERAADIDQSQCRLYFGESSIANAGFGMYAGVHMNVDDLVAEPDILIPVTNRQYNNFNWKLDDLMWHASAHHLMASETLEITNVFSPGLGAAVNCHSGLVNIKRGYAKWDSAGLHRSVDPGAGAFSYYHSVETRVQTNIEAGSELFVEYGDHWFATREETMGPIPTAEDFKVADSIFRSLHDLDKRDLEEGGSGISALMREGVFDILRDVVSERVSMALPSIVQEDSGNEKLGMIAEIGTARHSMPNFVRSSEWLEENAMCADNIQVGHSLIPQAGRGGFARRSLKQGESVVPVPVIPLHRRALDVYFADETQTLSEFAGQHLITNYCFGHEDSEVVLLPYSPGGSFINHGKGDVANVAIRFASWHLGGAEKFLEMTPEELLGDPDDGEEAQGQEGFGLLMEVYALRDIEAGEEILLDYGSGWEDAWEEHVSSWTPPDNAESYLSAAEYIEKFGKGGYIDVRTVEEQLVNPYPSNTETFCYYTPVSGQEGLGEDPSDSVHLEFTELNTADEKCLIPCEIVRREMWEGEDFYTAVMSNPPVVESDCEIDETREHIVSWIPRGFITIIDSPSSRDNYLPNAFRHFIGVPDDVFPDSWKE